MRSQLPQGRGAVRKGVLGRTPTIHHLAKEENREFDQGRIVYAIESEGSFAGYKIAHKGHFLAGTADDYVAAPTEIDNFDVDSWRNL